MDSMLCSSFKSLENHKEYDVFLFLTCFESALPTRVINSKTENPFKLSFTCMFKNLFFKQRWYDFNSSIGPKFTVLMLSTSWCLLAEWLCKTKQARSKEGGLLNSIVNNEHLHSYLGIGALIRLDIKVSIKSRLG